MSYIFWSIAGIIFIVIELIATGLVSVWLGVSAFIVAILSFVTKQIDIQLIVFAVLSLLFIFTTRIFIRIRKTEDNSNTITDTVKIVKIISDTEYEVSYKGAIWSAFSDQALHLDIDNLARIVSFKGNKIKIDLNK